MESQFGRMHWELSDRESALSHFQQALAILEQEQDTVELARAMSSMSQMHMLASEFDDAIVWGERALILGKRLGAEDVVVHALNNVGVAFLNIKGRDREQGIDMLRESKERALSLGLSHDACRAHLNPNEQLLGLCRYSEAQAGFEKLRAYAIQVNAQAYVETAVSRLAIINWLAGDWAESLVYQKQLMGQDWGNWQVWFSNSLCQIYNDLHQAGAGGKTWAGDAMGRDSNHGAASRATSARVRGSGNGS